MTNHDAVRGGQDAVVVLQALLVLDLGHDLDRAPARAQHVADVLDVAGLAHERRRDEVDLVREAEVDQVVAVLLGDGRQVDHHAGQVHVLALANRLVVLDRAHHRRRAGGGAHQATPPGGRM